MSPPTFLTTNSDIASITASVAIFAAMYQLNNGVHRQSSLMDGPGDLEDLQIDEFIKKWARTSKFCSIASICNAAFLAGLRLTGKGGDLASIGGCVAAVAMVWKVERGTRELEAKLMGLVKARDAGIEMH